MFIQPFRYHQEVLIELVSQLLRGRPIAVDHRVVCIE